MSVATTLGQVVYTLPEIADAGDAQMIRGLLRPPLTPPLPERSHGSLDRQ